MDTVPVCCRGFWKVIRVLHQNAELALFGQYAALCKMKYSKMKSHAVQY